MQAGRLQATYEKFKDQADFWWIYIAEAHAIDDKRPSTRVKIMEHKTFEERTEVATNCAAALELKIPKLVDDMDNTVATAYQGAPDRLFIIGKDSKMAYSGEKGPHGFDVDEMSSALESILAGKVPEIVREPSGNGPQRRGGGGGGQQGGGRGGDPAARIAQMDANKDGKLTKDELPEMAQRRFPQMDTDGNGFLDAAEQKAMAERMAQGRGRGGNTGGGNRQRPQGGGQQGGGRGQSQGGPGAPQGGPGAPQGGPGAPKSEDQPKE